MFKANTSHLQGDFFSFENDLSLQQQKNKSFLEACFFYERVFCRIDESLFSCLYSSISSRPNSPINAMVSSLILKEKNNWTFEDLFRELNFNILVKHSLGLKDLSILPFNYKTLFNFLKRLNDHYTKEEESLLEKVFNNLSLSEIKKLNLHTDIQRTDSTLISSNIKKISRLQLLLEIVINLDQILSDNDKSMFSKELNKYTSFDSKEYIYNLSSKDLPHEIKKIAEFYYKLHLHLKAKSTYDNIKEFQLFERVYREHIKIEDSIVTVIPAKELPSDILQSPYDEDATYRSKNKEESQGFKINAVETASPDNPINLLTDVSVDKNNIDDSKILEQRLRGVKEKTPDLNEFHTDGGYGSTGNDEEMNELDVDHIQTAIRGRKAGVEVIIEKDDDKIEAFTVKCPFQQVESEPTKKRNKADFDKSICDKCSLKEKCRIHKARGKFYFESKDYIANKRKRNIDKIPNERKFCRNNVEATMHEFKCKLNHKCKLKTRGLFRAIVFAFTTAIAINFGRIFRFENNNKLDLEEVVLNCFYFLLKGFIKGKIGLNYQ